MKYPLIVLILIIIIAIIIVLLLNKTPKDIKNEIQSKLLIKDSVYHPQNNVGNLMNFIIINLMTKITIDDINKIVNAVKIHTEKNFAPIWGTSANFIILNKTFPSEDQMTKGNVLIYLVDDLIEKDKYFPVIAAHWMTVPHPNDGVNGSGAQPSSLIAEVPLVPIGIPIVVIPYGNVKYGLVAGLKGYTPPSEEILNVFGIALSHEVFECIVDPFPPGNGGNFQILVNDTQTIMYVKEVCDPTQYAPQVEIDGITLSNFVTPDYFNIHAKKGTLFDFKGYIKQPLTPYNGEQYGLILFKGESLQAFVDKSDGISIKRYLIADIYNALFNARGSELDLSEYPIINRD